MASATAPTTGIGTMSTEDQDFETASSDSDARSHTGKSKPRSPEELTARKKKREERRRLRTASQKNTRLAKLCDSTLPRSTAATSRQTPTDSTVQWPPLHHEQPAVDGETCLSTPSQVPQMSDKGTALVATSTAGGYIAPARDPDPEDFLDRTWATVAKKGAKKKLGITISTSPTTTEQRSVTYKQARIALGENVIRLEPREQVDVTRIPHADLYRGICGAAQDRQLLPLLNIKTCWRSNTILVKTSDEAQALRLLRMSEIPLNTRPTLPVRAYQVPNNQISRGVIFNCTPDESNDTLMTALQCEHADILAARAMGHRGTVLITFAAPVPPRHVVYWGQTRRVEQYQPRALVCRRCHMPGHKNITCPAQHSVCSGCGNESHTQEGEECPHSRTPEKQYCKQCKANGHLAVDPNCPKNKAYEERKQLQIRERQGRSRRRLSQSRQLTIESAEAESHSGTRKRSTSRVSFPSSSEADSHSGTRKRSTSRVSFRSSSQVKGADVEDSCNRQKTSLANTNDVTDYTTAVSASSESSGSCSEAEGEGRRYNRRRRKNRRRKQKREHRPKVVSTEHHTAARQGDVGEWRNTQSPLDLAVELAQLERECEQAEVDLQQKIQAIKDEYQERVKTRRRQIRELQTRIKEQEQVGRLRTTPSLSHSSGKPTGGRSSPEESKNPPSPQGSAGDVCEPPTWMKPFIEQIQQQQLQLEQTQQLVKQQQQLLQQLQPMVAHFQTMQQHGQVPSQ